MDIARPDLKRKRTRQLALWAGVAAVLLTVSVVLVMRLKPAAPTVDRSTIWPDTVKRGPLICQVRSSTGTLVPREDSIELIPAQTDATVVRIVVLPGTKVTPDTVLADLADPHLLLGLTKRYMPVMSVMSIHNALQVIGEKTEQIQ